MPIYNYLVRSRGNRVKFGVIPMRTGVVTYINDQNIAGFRASSEMFAEHGLAIKTVQISPTWLNAGRKLLESVVHRSTRDASLIGLLLSAKRQDFVVIKPAEIVYMRPLYALAIWVIAKLRGTDILCSWENCWWNLKQVENLASRFAIGLGTALLRANGVRHFAASQSCANDVLRWNSIKADILFQAPDVPGRILQDGPLPPSEPPCVINIATPRTRKGIDLFIRVAQICIASHPSVRFIWIGGQPGSQFQALVDGAKLGNRLTFISKVQPPFELIQMASVIAFTSRSEAFGQVVAESLAFGRTVVAFSGTGAEEVIGSTGVLVEPFDVDAMASSILSVVTHTPAQRINHSAWQRYCELFSPEAFSKRVSDYFLCNSNAKDRG